jgi:hypothetical protein
VALWLLCEVSEHSKLVSEVTGEAMGLKILETSWHSKLEWKDINVLCVLCSRSGRNMMEKPDPNLCEVALGSLGDPAHPLPCHRAPEGANFAGGRKAKISAG